MTSYYKKIYMLIRFAKHTGGMELAHQFIHKLRELGQEAYIVYVDGDDISKNQTITKEYNKYNIETTDTIEDSEDNLLMIPEVFFNHISTFRKINIGCWWMSVDNRYGSAGFFNNFVFSKTLRGKLAIIKNFRKYKTNFTDHDLKKLDNRIIHFYQSIYAQQHLLTKGFSNILPLGDYINSSFFNKSSNKIPKENIVLYNPAKGYKFTKKIIDYNPDIQFIPLKGYSREELTELMKKAKVYIDFGHFPGKDRLSREAAINDVIIITSKNGAAAYYEDVTIPSKYKYENKKRNIKYISNLIRECFKNYVLIIKDFDLYRRRIKKEEEEFDDQIKKTFFIL